MASFGAPPVSLRHGVQLVAQAASTVEQVLLAVGDQVGHVNISYASYVQVSPLATPSTRITVSGVPPFIPNEALERELKRFGKFASNLRTVALGCKDEKLKHVQSLRRQVFMFLNCPTQTLDVSFRVRHEEGFYMVYASSGNVKCFECGESGHKRVACPRRRHAAPPGAAGPGRPSPGRPSPGRPSPGRPSPGRRTRGRRARGRRPGAPSPGPPGPGWPGPLSPEQPGRLGPWLRNPVSRGLLLHPPGPRGLRRK
ncbi:hypothetical protein NHX12_034127 [Muraenolepis orangiensis]|uniref:CCHC-type domain-containing protein n=1 Tax=Muraenolepis orangiensis TaxID=630683 RepID=A0A9Q0IH34_9TELE|nr:hypothetical protein NHX12_034127 [Muraenolepis orangiensis]